MKAYPKASAKVVCHDCKDLIESNDDLVVLTKWFSCIPVHAACYGKSIKKFFRGRPVNSGRYSLFVGVASFFGTYLALTSLFLIPDVIKNLPSPYAIGSFLMLLLLTGICFIPLKIRIDSIKKYEKPLPK